MDSFNSVEKETPPCGYSQKPAKPITLQHTDTDTKNEKQENKEETKEYSADDLAEYLKKSHISISKIKNTQNKSDGRQ